MKQSHIPPRRRITHAGDAPPHTSSSNQAKTGIMLPLRVPEARYHVLPDELVEWLDSVERTIEGDEEGQHDLVKQVQPRDSGPMVLQVEEINADIQTTIELAIYIQFLTSHCPSPWFVSTEELFQFAAKKLMTSVSSTCIITKK